MSRCPIDLHSHGGADEPESFSRMVAERVERARRLVEENRLGRAKVAAEVIVERGVIPPLPTHELPAVANELSALGRDDLAACVAGLGSEDRETRLTAAVAAVKAGLEVPPLPADEAILLFERVSGDEGEGVPPSP